MSSRKPIKPAKTTKPLPLARRSAKEQDKINKIKLPDMIHCHVCSMARPMASYSEAQLEQLRVRIFDNGGKVPEGLSLAKCDDCTLNPNVQRMCKSCGRFKRLREFSKAQRFGELHCVQCVDWSQQFEHRNDTQELIDGHYHLPALDMERPEKKEGADMARIAGPSPQAMITYGDPKALVVSRPSAGASGTELIQRTVTLPRELSLNDANSEEVSLDTTSYL